MIASGPSYRQAPFDEGTDGGGMWWPDGDIFARSGELERILFEASSSEMRLGLQLVEGRDSAQQRQAAIALGTGVELLAKACIARLDPVQMAEKGAEDARLLLASRQLEATKPSALEGVKSIGLERAVRSAFLLANASPPSVQQVSIARNAAAHMGLVLRDQLRDAAHEAAVAVDALITSFGLEDATFWSNAKALSTLALDPSKSRAQRAVGMREQCARDALDNKLELVDLETLRSTKSRGPENAEMTVEISCSVCGSSAWLEYFPMGPVGWHVFEMDVVDHQEVQGVLVAFNCSVCTLHYAGWQSQNELFDVYDWPGGVVFVNLYDPAEWVPRDSIELTRSESSRAALAEQLGLS